MTEYHVAKFGSDRASGGAADPFLTINQAARVAAAGDEVVVHEGVYREWVKPRRGGSGDARRITYRAAEGQHVAIKGSEQVVGWVRQTPDAVGAPTSDRAGGVWVAKLPNSLFGDFNPYAERLRGDWLVRPVGAEAPKHLGDVYLNGRSFFEVGSVADVFAPTRRKSVRDDWTGLEDPVADPEQTARVWHAEVGPEETTIWANFAGADPNAELVEVNVRRSVFYPLATGRNYITVRGFELAHAACPWTPPTADQPGLIGPNWARGWIIED
ncbi:MAG: right-handed parallel beta-helix repeat-containing protein, partial [Bifidobacteriaceae bacterium]|nr:right-handed parallel beta-helix repeat-containing protein [Bifidobacteriaceae bacterium]